MSRPPREGARWGDDPPPEQPKPQPDFFAPDVYETLCRQYGQHNVDQFTQLARQNGRDAEYVIFFLMLGERYGFNNLDHARRIRSALIRDYPTLLALKRDDVEVVMNILARAQNNMDYVSEDGRPHSMPETLSLMEKQLGKVLALTPNAEEFGKVILRYGDEEQGIGYKNAVDQVVRNRQMTHWGIAIAVVVAIVFAFLAMAQ